MSGAGILFALLLGQSAPSPTGFVIFPPRMAAELLQQCSRAVPKAGEAGWTPRQADIARLEARLPAALTLARSDYYTRQKLRGAPKGWARQYVGVIRGGKRFVYGNFVPSPMLGWRSAPINICDGGPGFFGAEYDVEMDAISHLAFNGIG